MNRQEYLTKPFIQPVIKQIYPGLILIEDVSNFHNAAYTLEIFESTNGVVQSMRLKSQSQDSGQDLKKSPFSLHQPDNVSPIS